MNTSRHLKKPGSTSRNLTMARRRRRNQLAEPTTVRIEAMSHEGRGIANINGKTVFVFGALKDELVKIQFRKTHKTFDEASTLEVLEASPERIAAKCDAFERCGGCSLQHWDNDTQVDFKQQTLLEMMHHAGVEGKQVLPPLRSSPWGYRRKARLGVKYVRKKERVLVGFRERNAPYLADMSQCEVLIPEVGHRLSELAELIQGLDARESIPQIEVAADDDNIVLVFRHLNDLSEGDREQLFNFAKQTGLWLQLNLPVPIRLTTSIQRINHFIFGHWPITTYGLILVRLILSRSITPSINKWLHRH